ncbi:hypothetical protein BBF96_06355 [Anoxybacter fermentans]|uniref:Uncharacterized protein n=1 Tax=Anoxybacter fermentans TaxID=1323375 RepID=A0A3Q9HQ18_9FIRM|nr:SIR2 family protein [Anoxybacter fermentans]AZR73052.1 hypothetical protein BBF96_06355 [Anoxybacter fermentans]
MKLDTAFLIGAGFSYPAGIPIMRDLVMDFPRILEGEEKRIYQELKELIPDIEEDFELLMELCHDLKDAPITLINRLAQRCFGEKFIDLEQLIKGAKRLDYHLKEYLRKKFRVERNKLKYLYPLAEWLKKTGAIIDIFSLNYDLVIEILCKEFSLSYTDGFLVNWNPCLFKDPKFQVKLYKLHGSFIWYQSELGERIKIPILGYRNNLRYLANDEMVSMMVYPRREKKEPFQELLKMFRERLLTLERLVVIGYSFRDQELRQFVEEGLRKNQSLRLELVSPHSMNLKASFTIPERIDCFQGGVEEWIQIKWGKNKKRADNFAQKDQFFS